MSQAILSHGLGNRNADRCAGHELGLCEGRQIGGAIVLCGGGMGQFGDRANGAIVWCSSRRDEWTKEDAGFEYSERTRLIPSGGQLIICTAIKYGGRLFPSGKTGSMEF